MKRLLPLSSKFSILVNLVGMWIPSVVRFLLKLGILTMVSCLKRHLWKLCLVVLLDWIFGYLVVWSMQMITRLSKWRKAGTEEDGHEHSGNYAIWSTIWTPIFSTWVREWHSKVDVMLRLSLYCNEAMCWMLHTWSCYHQQSCNIYQNVD